MRLFRKEALEAQQVSALGRILLFTPRIADVLIALVLLFTFLVAIQDYNAFVVKYRAGKDNGGNHGGEMIGCCVYGIAAVIRFADSFSGGLIFLNPIC